jgi:PHS family inorganic phosphate transporter-like MFS transporter
MLSIVFYMQSIGALVANVITIIVVASSHDSLALKASPSTCTGDCLHTVDAMWRWIIGLGAVPSTIAILVRWWIPESPRYTLEVEKDPARAKRDVHAFYQPAPSAASK